MMDHICHCNICAASRALTAVMEAPALPEQKAALEALNESFNAFLEWSANLEMEYHYQIGRIADALFQRGRDVSHILQAIEELKARYQPPPKGTPSLFYGTPLHAPAPGRENNGHAGTWPAGGDNDPGRFSLVD